MTREPIHRIAAIAPVVLSVLAFALVGAALAFGWERGMKDEGAVAHTWQLLIAAQAPLIAIFLVTADWRRFRREFMTLAMQGCALAAALAPVAILRLYKTPGPSSQLASVPAEPGFLGARASRRQPTRPARRQRCEIERHCPRPDPELPGIASV